MFKLIEQYSFKISIGIALVVILFLIRMSSNFTVWKVSTENDIKTMAATQFNVITNCDKITGRVAKLELEKTRLMFKEPK